MDDLPEASFMQKSDFVPAVERGLALGGATGILAGLVAIALPGAPFVIAGGVLLASSLAGAGVGAWLGGMVGLNVGNTRLKQFADAIESGALLVMADVPDASRGDRGWGEIPTPRGGDRRHGAHHSCLSVIPASLHQAASTAA